MFSGGALMRMSIFTLGVMPYFCIYYNDINAVIFDSLKALKEQGTQGRKNPTIHKIFNNSFGTFPKLWYFKWHTKFIRYS